MVKTREAMQGQEERMSAVCLRLEWQGVFDGLCKIDVKPAQYLYNLNT